jgi:hypothetical protein
LRSACHVRQRGLRRMREGTRPPGTDRRTDLATNRMSSSSLSRSARALTSDRTGLYMLKKYSGTRNEKAWASIAKATMVQGCVARVSEARRGMQMRRTPKVDIEILQATKEGLCGRRCESSEEFLCQGCMGWFQSVMEWEGKRCGRQTIYEKEVRASILLSSG